MDDKDRAAAREQAAHADSLRRWMAEVRRLRAELAEHELTVHDRFVLAALSGSSGWSGSRGWNDAKAFIEAAFAVADAAIKERNRRRLERAMAVEAAFKERRHASATDGWGGNR